ncbi:MAG: hypothetical protein AB1792_05980 [Candidatus Zixiibacteriota bacterium]
MTDSLAVSPEAMPGDSIYAREITIDASGISVVGRDGRRLRFMTSPGGRIELPDIPGVIVPPLPGGHPVVLSEDKLSNFVLAGNITIDPDDVADGDVVGIFCDVHVRGQVDGDVVVVFGDIDVEGTINGSAVAPFGTVRLGPEGYVRSDVTASRVLREPGGRIGGQRQETRIAPFGVGPGEIGRTWGKPTVTILILLKIVLWLFLVLVAYALAAKNITKVKDRVRVSFFKSFLMGVLAQILVLPLFLLLIVTIVGIPVALFLMPLLMFAGLILAQAAVGQYVSDLLAENADLTLRTPLARTILGVLVLQAPALLMIISIWGTGPTELGGVFRVTTLSLLTLSIVIGYVVMTLGTGAVVLTRWGTRPKDVEAPPPPTAPHTELPGATPLPLAGTGNS